MLAAVMFADMVGFTALMQRDEALATERRDRHRDVMKRAIGDHGGRIIQYFGDGTLAVFPSALEAVAAARRIQAELQQEPPIPLRIGLHLGDIAFDEEGAYGDSVNVAARLESLAIPGCVLISSRVYDEIRNHPQEVTSLGAYHLKNVERPVEVYALAGGGLVIPDPLDVRGRAGGDRSSIAVLPFANFSSDPENEFFSDGITEELINLMTKIEGLRVISRTSVFAFKGAEPRHP